jgi:hypothetical protein
MRQRIRSHLTFANIASLAALFVALGGTTYAATGGNFLLGKPNSASSPTSLTAPVAGTGLRVTNASTHEGATALGLNVASGHAPFNVNSGVKVANLNADKLDGLDSTAFYPSANAKSFRFDASHCVNPTDPGCSTSISFGGLKLDVSCFSVSGTANPRLNVVNASQTDRFDAAEGFYNSNTNTASGRWTFATPGNVLIQVNGVSNDAGSMINFTTAHETANFAAQTDLDNPDNKPHCAFSLFAFKST